MNKCVKCGRSTNNKGESLILFGSNNGPMCRDCFIKSPHPVTLQPAKEQGTYEKLGQEIGKLVDVKNEQYGDSTNKTAEMLKVAYPDGVKPEQYKDMMLVTRIFDKINRIANGNQGEDSFSDLAGYGLLGMKDPLSKYRHTYP